MDPFVLILGMALVTFGVRYPMLAVIGRLRLPDGVIRALRYVPVAVLTAIVAPAALLPEGTFDLRLENAHLIGSLAAVLVAWRTKNLLLTILIGMGVFLLWRLLTGALALPLF